MTDQSDRPGFWDAVRNRVVSSAEAEQVPSALRITTAYAWRLLVIAGAIAVIVWLVIQLKLLVVPILVALLLTALLSPAFTFMLRHRFPRWLAIVISVVGTLAIVTGLLWLAIWQISQQWDGVRDRAEEGIEQLRVYLMNGPLKLSETQLNDYVQKGLNLIQGQVDLLLNGALAIGTTAAHVATGALLALFVLLCVLFDGAGIWRWVVRLFPRRARAAADGAARMGWTTVVNYARTQLIVAVIDAVGIGLGAFLLGVPLAVPIGILVFLGAFIPIVGAVLTGIIAVVIALAYNGAWIALAMLAVVLLVQQVEGHVLQPFLMGAAVKVHPLAVVLSVAGGAMIAGIPGALFAVPLAAFVNVVAVALATGAWRGGHVQEGQLIWQTIPRERRAR
ncbi:AI-2E family transporter [Microbacterium gorillae]|uniref:AI-2E family transporter n=1 Tax=Microbacterium gorillae TaxID=1231063 RepID=UPI00058DA483|nr:AI-2E family transporter [Microbacterium gorillae]